MFHLQNTSIMNITLSNSWISGSYANICGFEVYIDSSLSYASFENLHDSNNSYVFQGNEADDVISEIAEIWENDNLKQDEAIDKWIRMHI